VDLFAQFLNLFGDVRFKGFTERVDNGIKAVLSFHGSLAFRFLSADFLLQSLQMASMSSFTFFAIDKASLEKLRDQKSTVTVSGSGKVTTIEPKGLVFCTPEGRPLDPNGPEKRISPTPSLHHRSAACDFKI
jgi:hypothetical protein